MHKDQFKVEALKISKKYFPYKNQCTRDTALFLKLLDANIQVLDTFDMIYAFSQLFNSNEEIVKKLQETEFDSNYSIKEMITQHLIEWCSKAPYFSKTHVLAEEFNDSDGKVSESLALLVKLLPATRFV